MRSFYTIGKLSWRQTFGYNQYGNFSDLLSFDEKGNQQAHLHISTNKNGVITERSGWGRNDRLDWQQTFDPETQVEHFTKFDEFGKAKLTCWCFKEI